uniref:Uncharacterized protein n=1 Tax=viral metagenome TaxID=1070528 RepID=A0A6M3IVI0_9ZZZZ
MNIAEEISMLRYEEAVVLPKFKASLDRLLNKRAYDYVLTTHSVEAQDLPQFVEKAVNEGNAVLIEREHNGFMVVIWRD